MKWRPGTDSGGAVLSFADDFHRADQPFMLGDLWSCTPMELSTIVGGSNLAASINVAGNQASFTICSSNGKNEIICFPIVLSWATVFTSPQFSQCRITADNSGGGIFAFNGPCVLTSTNKETGYYISTANQVGPSALHYVVYSMNGGAAETALTTAVAFNIGDTLRIEGIPNSPSAGITTIKSYLNGVLQNTTQDAVGHYSAGVCGYNDGFVSAGVTTSIDNFSCGVIGH